MSRVAFQGRLAGFVEAEGRPVDVGEFSAGYQLALTLRGYPTR